VIADGFLLLKASADHAGTAAAGSIWAGDVPDWITAIGTGMLALFAIVAAYYARKAFLKQSQEVSAIERQVKDQEELTQQQGKLLAIQSGQLELQRQQLDGQRQVNSKQVEVLDLQAVELRESTDQRKRETEERHRAQASRIFITQELSVTTRPDYAKWGGKPSFVAAVVNSSDQPIYDAEFRWHVGTAGHGEPNPEPLGIIMPGAQVRGTREFPPGATMDVSGAVVRFTDANQVRWLRRPDGYLREFR
jgi:hypothetical protein